MSKDNLIDKNRMQFLQKRQRDDVGEVFEYDGKILRGIYREKVVMVKNFMDCGCLDELINRGYFPETVISEYLSDDYGIILEHKRISPVIYPQEWTFSMLKDSALMVVEVAMIARKYGYNMKDCHGFNVLIDEGQPVFIDLGSFHANACGTAGWQPHKEFLRFYYYPLYTWKDGLEYISKLSIFSANLMPHAEHYIYKSKILRFIGFGFVNKVMKYRFAHVDLSTMSYEKIAAMRCHGAIKSVLKFAKPVANLMTWYNLDLVRLRSRVKRLKRPDTGSQWKNYHANIKKKNMRYDSIIELVNKYCFDAESAIDIAGNQGLFSEKVLSSTRIKHVICQDNDESATDAGYRRTHKKPHADKSIAYANYNIMGTIIKTTHSPPWERFRKDVVFALALLHHLILTQGYDLDDILAELFNYSSKYVCIEFMPKGLWVQGAEVKIPSWYTVEWFRIAFCNFFELLEEQQIAENYIIFLGRKRHGSCK